MEKQKQVYRYCRYNGNPLLAKREIAYEIKLSSRLLLDELCYKWNKSQLETAINQAIDTGDQEKFLEISEDYKFYTFE